MIFLDAYEAVMSRNGSPDHVRVVMYRVVGVRVESSQKTVAVGRAVGLFEHAAGGFPLRRDRLEGGLGFLPRQSGDCQPG